jgi:glycosyltransferase involved in cell wall biosynthesis
MRSPDAAPRIAVIVPCFDDGPLLLEAVASLEGSEPFELVVVDDASTQPETLTILERLETGTRVVHHEQNRGLAEARNTGLRATSAPYVFPLDSDDLAVPEALTRMADLLDAYPEAAVCFGDYEEFDGQRLVRAVPEELDPFRLAYINEYPVASLFRRSALEEAGGWRALGPGYEDWDLWLTLAERDAHGVHAGHGFITYRRRIHGGRMLSAAKREHKALYRRLRTDHPRLFSELPRHRRASSLGAARKLLYPVVYGGRRRFAVERRVKAALDRLGIWTLRRRVPYGPGGAAEDPPGGGAP